MMTRDLLPLTNYFATTNKIRIDYHVGSHYFVHVPLVLQNVKASCDTIVPLYLFEVVFKSVNVLVAKVIKECATFMYIHNRNVKC